MEILTLIFTLLKEIEMLLKDPQDAELTNELKEWKKLLIKTSGALREEFSENVLDGIDFLKN